MGHGTSDLKSAAAGLLAALLFLVYPASGAPLALPLLYLAPLPLFSAGLALNVRGAVMAGLVASLVTGLVAGNVQTGLLFLGAYALPVVLVLRQALLSRRNTNGEIEWYPPGPTLLWLIGYSLVALAAAALLTSGAAGGLHGVVTRAVESFSGTMPVALSGPFEKMGADRLALWLPGITGVSWLLMMVVNGALAQLLVRSFGRNLRPGMRLSEMHLPSWAVLAFSLAALVAVVSPAPVAAIALGMALMCGIGFFFVGLGVLHAILRGRPLVLTALYVSLVLSWPALIVAALGLVEQWIDLRRRVASPH
ncbi:MAG: DUF2232 domain-containing protein [Alphaproteobacteria bacterium]|jgi:hypothetical protein|nr:DUF2232 domain-containing protein [Alphaproteobacteria bacterium]